MIKHILLDIDDTLFPSFEFSKLARKNAINAMIRLGIGISYEKLERKLKEIINKKGSNYSGHFNELCKTFKIKEASKYVAAAIAAYHNTKNTIAPFPGVQKTLLELKEKGYKIHIATNGNAIKQWDKLIRLGLHVFVDRVFVSEEVGREKDENFFRYVLNEIKAKRKECLMIGDKEDSDIIPAKKAGILTIRAKTGRLSTKKTSADYSIKNLEEIWEILEKV